MTSIHETLSLLRNQKAAVLGRKSVETLSAFLTGFAFARRDAEDTPDFRFLLAFDEWVHKRFHVESTQGWAKIIAFYCDGPTEEMELFWKLYDEFMTEPQHVSRPSKANGHPAKARNTR